ncbi:TrmH family RNA methyltransferase [Curtobacterium oceanosedimentum]|uniref:TrmH family RNA methyltransferase n=1 Tax=Curtobacterium oceanosedimentum TaxID=465820 RepID=UPI001CE120BC|nr:TrmH family RNA methyltransferase [Curtobacterium oceanosedimentum]MCA5922299.1 rRNA methyltransferase [Curtobacterium oceanosedimentum]
MTEHDDQPSPQQESSSSPSPSPSHELTSNGVGPHPEPWPDDPRLDPELLAAGDSRNVIDRYRYWSMDAIVADLDTRRHAFDVAIENWQHDLNIGSIVRSANAFLAGTVHIIGRRRWNKRGAMVTDRYQHVRSHPDVESFLAAMAEDGRPVIAIDNTPGAERIETATIPERCVFLFGQEGPGLTDEAVAGADGHLEITQFGSTRSINASAAAAIVMHSWVVQHARLPDAP